MLSIEIWLDRRENPRKCTMTPYKKDARFAFQYFHRDHSAGPIRSEWLLHIEGKCLSEFARPALLKSIAAIDCHWKRVPKIAIAQTTLVKVPHEFQTAYPRKSKLGTDPDGGLATIEAIFIAAAFAGNWDLSLLSHYYFAQDFLQINQQNWYKYNLCP